jgi:hypothetical protein
MQSANSKMQNVGITLTTITTCRIGFTKLFSKLYNFDHKDIEMI